MNQLWEDRNLKCPEYFDCNKLETFSKKFVNAECKFFYTNMEYGPVVHNGKVTNVFIVKQFSRQEFQNMTENDVQKMISEHRIIVWFKANRKQGWCFAGRILDMMRLVSCGHFGILRREKVVALDKDGGGAACDLFSYGLYTTLIRNLFGRIITETVKPDLVLAQFVNDMWQVNVNNVESEENLQELLNVGESIAIPGPGGVVQIRRHEVILSRIDRMFNAQTMLDTEIYDDAIGKSEEERKHEEAEFERANKLTVVGDTTPKTLDAVDYILIAHGAANVVTLGSVCCTIS